MKKEIRGELVKELMEIKNEMKTGMKVNGGNEKKDGEVEKGVKGKRKRVEREERGSKKKSGGAGNRNENFSGKNRK